MKAGGDHAADPITTKMLADKMLAEDDGGEVDLSLGLSIGGGNKRKVGPGAGVYLNGSFGDLADPNRKCRPRVEEKAKEEEVGRLWVSDVRTQNPVVDPNPVVPMYVPVAGGSKLSCMVACCIPPPPVVVSDSGRSFLPPISSRSLWPFAGPNINHCPNPNRSGEISGKSSAMIKRGPSFSASPVRSYSGPLRGRSSSSSCETGSNSVNLGATEKPREHASSQEAMSKPRAQSQAATALASIDGMPCVMAKGADGKVISGFLYSYEGEEGVSIVCVCHGSCFSPAGFVRHAGGVESSHPLRQITVVVPS